MKALFVRCYGKLTADMMIGGLIDMGVPPVYLRSKLEDAGLSAPFIEKPNPKAQISAHYFHIPENGEKPMLLKERDIFKLWRDICEKGAPDWEDTGWKVFSALTSGASDAIDEIAGNVIDLRRIGVSEENLISLYLFLACLDYLEVESLFVVPFSLKAGRSERARATLHILTDAGSTVGEPSTQRTFIHSRQPCSKGWRPNSCPWTAVFWQTRLPMAVPVPRSRPVRAPSPSIWATSRTAATPSSAVISRSSAWLGI